MLLIDFGSAAVMGDFPMIGYNYSEAPCDIKYCPPERFIDELEWTKYDIYCVALILLRVLMPPLLQVCVLRAVVPATVYCMRLRYGPTSCCDGVVLLYFATVCLIAYCSLKCSCMLLLYARTPSSCPPLLQVCATDTGRCMLLRHDPTASGAVYSFCVVRQCCSSIFLLPTPQSILLLHTPTLYSYSIRLYRLALT
eukprot:1421268-Rhodomonas_salina.2